MKWSINGIYVIGWGVPVAFLGRLVLITPFLTCKSQNMPVSYTTITLGVFFI
ncbi:MAG: hypothetical protein RBG13Loki_0244 [Promethearchaeota archaeon CR_4]|nr:MAG: hypothetical protein RBG13Loki_0244 [Candidatus Lokiarchaeota archaeon CR_4]